MPLDISIPSTSVSSTADKPFTIYTIRIQQPIRTITTAKRYSDFVRLHTDLTAQAGGTPPPATLPGKSWWFTRTVNNPTMTEQRRRDLEQYLRAVEAADDGRWRHTSAWRTFLQLGTTMRSSPYSEHGVKGTANGNTNGGGGHWEPGKGGAVGIRDPATWLAVHQELKGNLHQARLALTRREQAQTAQQQHEAGAAAKKYLVLAGTLISALDDGLRRLSGGGGGSGGAGAAGNRMKNGRAPVFVDDDSDAPVEKLGDGELRRRRDLLSGARKEKEGLEGVLGALAVKSLAAGGSGAGAPASTGVAAAPADKAHLFRGGLNGGVGGGANGLASKRTLGAPAAKETSRTRELDNTGVVQLQRQLMREQDEDVADLSHAVRRMREMGVQINDELQLQNEMLRMLDDDVDRVDSKVRVAKKRIDKIR
ncbi:snare complex subunit [Diplodia corticola]|uniref:Snare complex subunit n=1 Tax=Diplodia corticola TaxID=236234 RepID=A0A1J9QM48_9PEZI|nr:snare complex subunit [Diplodia corticola]OJD29130.1 snare complex subunit [Diplodia corticola]